MRCSTYCSCIMSDHLKFTASDICLVSFICKLMHLFSMSGKFYTLTTGANERRWEKMKDRLYTVADSFKIFNVWSTCSHQVISLEQYILDCKRFCVLVEYKVMFFLTSWSSTVFSISFLQLKILYITISKLLFKMQKNWVLFTQSNINHIVLVVNRLTVAKFKEK